MFCIIAKIKDEQEEESVKRSFTDDWRGKSEENSKYLHKMSKIKKLNPYFKTRSSGRNEKKLQFHVVFNVWGIFSLYCLQNA